MIKSILAQVVLAAILVVGWAHANEAPEVVCHEAEPVLVCSEPRDLEQGSGQVRECEVVRQIVCETVENKGN